ncbi:T22J18.15-RELATED [Salix purpurea]|uniref:T22J18.15-RELATED n=1 Tax=Salix purpurea TaxID=77065 RepID=A0A9Q0WBA3_SALPP|nr:T22J18.15-RELATED [Salix purpurea]
MSPKTVTPHFRPPKPTLPCRTASFSSSSSLSSCSSLRFLDDSPLSPATPLQFSGVPFSWEHLPGIPKNQSFKKKDSTLKVLPLPPPAAPASISRRIKFEEIGIRKKLNHESFRRDPFLAALVQCSKDEDDDDDDQGSNFSGGSKVTRSISDRFGFINLYTSCKKTCVVSDSIVYLPRSSGTSYDLISRRSR